MPEEITGPEDLQRRIDDRRGFLANKKAGRLTYTVHDLGAFCNMSIGLPPGNDSAYYADGTSEFTQMWNAMDWIECANCRSIRLRQP
jgi:hypothetical protein